MSNVRKAQALSEAATLEAQTAKQMSKQTAGHRTRQPRLHPPIRKGIYGHMGTGAGSHFLAGGEISNFNPPGKGQRKAPTVSYSNGRKAQALSGAAMLEARTARLERLRQQRTHTQKVAAIICRGRFAHLSAGCRGRFGISRSNRGRGGCNAHSSTQRRGCSACV